MTQSKAYRFDDGTWALMDGWEWLAFDSKKEFLAELRRRTKYYKHPDSNPDVQAMRVLLRA